jgi:hypothetical protein
MLDQLLEKAGLKFEDLSKDEKETLLKWDETLQHNQMSIEKVREYVSAMKVAVEQELTIHDLGSKQDLFLKARLRNYMLLEGFLSTPEKARKQIEAAISGLVRRT